MTTIAYNHKDKEVAVESRTTSGGVVINDKANKSIKNNKGLWVMAGKPCDYHILIELGHNDSVEVLPDCQGFLITDGKCFFVSVNDQGYCKHDEMTENFTIGSGGDFALSAMDFGCSAKDAVKYAMTRDVYSGGRVRVFKVDK